MQGQDLVCDGYTTVVHVARQGISLKKMSGGGKFYACVRHLLSVGGRSMLVTGPLDKGQKAELHGCVRHSQAVVMPEGVLF